jgi:hypothetical protein
MPAQSHSRLPGVTRGWFSGTLLSPQVEAYVAYLKDRGYARAVVAGVKPRLFAAVFDFA